MIKYSITINTKPDADKCLRKRDGQIKRKGIEI